MLKRSENPVRRFAIAFNTSSKLARLKPSALPNSSRGQGHPVRGFEWPRLGSKRPFHQLRLAPYMETSMPTFARFFFDRRVTEGRRASPRAHFYAPFKLENKNLSKSSKALRSYRNAREQQNEKRNRTENRPDRPWLGPYMGVHYPLRACLFPLMDNENIG